MLPNIDFRFATPADNASLRRLLEAAGLPSADVSADRQEYILAHAGHDLVGCVGIEVRDGAALLRSFAVTDRLRGQGLGEALYERIVAHASLRGAKTAYVLTSTAEHFCAKRGFEKVDRSVVPAAIAATAEFASLCPASAVCMRRRLDTEPRHLR